MSENNPWGNLRTMIEGFTGTLEYEIVDSSGFEKLLEDFNQKKLKLLRAKYCPLDSIGIGAMDSTEDCFIVRTYSKETNEVIGDVIVRRDEVGEDTYKSDIDFLAKLRAYEYVKSKEAV